MKKLSAMLLLAGVFLAGCGNASSTGNSSANSKQVQIVAVGSTALQPLVESAQEQFVAKNANYQITVQGGGSGTGLSQVASGSVQIGNSDVFAEEKDGVDASKLVDHQVAVVGMAPVVNKAVGVKNVTKDQLIAIFTGKVKNWQELGGKDQEIVVVNRASGSGTRATFEKWGLDGAKTIQAQEQDSSGTVKKIVSSTPGAISYLALSNIDDSLEALSLDGVAPTAENIETNDWPIWSYEHMYTKGKPTKEIKKFLDYMVSDEVQEGLVKELGYLPVTKMQVSRSADGQVTEK
ncbi:phosphate ABC transporter substrate-binding protein PstS family protein [Enterococcus cecorum]|uniref:phosphate ABC transporter substrate-binding protein PstS family protein n=1 Tax=Enterococcus cecorum TaxID=44008 RepID=UPI002ACA40EC|nr:phosphate ABC transporter substrate-binding protein PstS family protein [Enterococcus cecorum]MDZ5439124.1 phosphate ABC transporter substrate-binding protein PstS family protein [Enterococcus cecorum]MDZ5497178.1 phosphate ABC transporter substrate-binding protein PstS family protein [Enterococcus cecorum]MDZ5499220.1 phosphate ABC transporter substrate-binding protein PstS family protein [Enterococcus cecorum]MDZ5561671.1 phosphate ABC transporter substrate-binding protein PstS family prot